jgi:hypothetical protein
MSVRQLTSGQNVGLFPSGKPGQVLLQHALHLRYVEECEPPPAEPSKRKPKTPPKAVPHARVTAEGRAWALQQTSPQKALEGLLAVFQKLGPGPTPDPSEVPALQAQLGELQNTVARLQQTIQEAVTRRNQDSERLQQMVREASEVMQRRLGAEPTPGTSRSADADLEQAMVSFIDSWQQHHHAGCPLPDLYADLKGRFQDLTIGTFHDRLRQLHTSNRLRLSGMSGSMDDLRQPELALLVSNKVMYYANAPDRTA